MSLSTYQSLLSKYSEKGSSLQQQLRWLSFVRLLLFISFIVFGYKSLSTGEIYFTLLFITLFVAFFIVLNLYNRIQRKEGFYKSLANLNRNEINFLNGQSSAHENGSEYIDAHHSYSYDLDIFGDGGLFPYLNRCTTPFGKESLSELLLHPDKRSILQRQEAIRELSQMPEFRQNIQAHGMMQEIKEKEITQLKTWINAPAFFKNNTLYYALLIFPLVTFGSLVYYFISENDNVLNLFWGLFIINLIISFSFARKIIAHLSVSSSVTKVLQQFSEQLKQIESQSFQSVLLKEIQEKLKAGNTAASKSISKLASLFNYLETILNLLISVLLNGFFLFHIHVLYALEKWKQEHGQYIMKWLQMLGEIETLNCFANLSFNNPSFCYPKLSDDEMLVANNMGHPLITNEKRINNSISFTQQRFIILTGSNMSGKSTFLRTLGINFILARAGSPVCAEQFIFYPYDVHVSMRINDSLQDSESFFYAELKRLQNIIQQLQSGNKTFVILDEILRGTNSNDKHNGTIGFIRKLVSANAFGIIATHDLTVSKLADEYPVQVSNKCFESEIINNELFFDYKLREGVCTTLSASFLMKKMEIIE